MKLVASPSPHRSHFPNNRLKRHPREREENQKSPARRRCIHIFSDRQADRQARCVTRCAGKKGRARARLIGPREIALISPRVRAAVIFGARAQLRTSEQQLARARAHLFTDDAHSPGHFGNSFASTFGARCVCSGGRTENRL